MNLDDLAKLAGIQKIDAPVEQTVEAPVAEQPMNGREDMKAMIALIDPEVLNKLGAEAPVEEEDKKVQLPIPATNRAREFGRSVPSRTRN